MDHVRFTKMPVVTFYEKQVLVKATYEHDGTIYKKTASLKGDSLRELNAIDSTEDRKRRAIAMAEAKWVTSLPRAAEPPILEAAAPLARNERSRQEPQRLAEEQGPIKRWKGQEPTGSRHEGKQQKGKGICGQNVLHSASGCAAGAWQRLGSFVLHALLLTSVLGEYNRLCAAASLRNPPVSFQDLPMLITQAGLLTWRWTSCTPSWHRPSHGQQQRKQKYSANRTRSRACDGSCGACTRPSPKTKRKSGSCRQLQMPLQSLIWVARFLIRVRPIRASQVGAARSGCKRAAVCSRQSRRLWYAVMEAKRKQRRLLMVFSIMTWSVSATKRLRVTR